MQNTAACTVLTPAEQALIFFSMLTHDDHNSHYVVARAAKGTWSEQAYKAEGLLNASFSDKAAYYFTRNGFSARQRRIEHARQVNALMFDIDCHGESPRAGVPLVIAAVSEAVSNGSLPCPTMQVDTGRGIQLYYVLEKATPCRIANGMPNQKGLDFVRDAERGLSDVLKSVVAGIQGAEVDQSVYDLARVGRIPGTYNEKAGRYALLFAHTCAYYTLGQLIAYRTRVAAPQKKRRGRVIAFDKLLISRLRKLEQLQEHRGFDCTGSRENMCFVHYNTATQVYGPEAALQHTLAFNAKFLSPLPQRDILSIKRTVDNVTIMFGVNKGQQGFYPLKKEALIEKLAMTQSEIEATGFFSSRKAEQRQQQKLQTQAKRTARNNQIVALYASGSLTQKQVAQHLGCSLRTVASVLKAAKSQFKQVKKVSLKVLAGSVLQNAALSQASDCPPYAKNCLTSCGVVRPGFVSGQNEKSILLSYRENSSFSPGLTKGCSMFWLLGPIPLHACQDLTCPTGSLALQSIPYPA